MDLLLYLSLGAVAGLISGLFGVGGGVVIVPILIFTFDAQGMSADVATHMAIGTSLATILVTSLSSIYTHHQKGSVRWDLVSRMTPGIVVGAVLGGLFALSLRGPLLQSLFGGFLSLIALQLLFYRPAVQDRPLPSMAVMNVAGTAIGGLSALLGIGGGALTAPLLTFYGVKIHHAVGSAAACGFPIALAAGLFYSASGSTGAGLPAHTLGYIYLPAWLGIVVVSMPCARIGALLAHRANAALLKKLFGIVLLLLGTRFVWANLTH
jgi:uncharacterized membrane protein YfcA